MSFFEGWIDEVEEGVVYGRVMNEGQEIEFWIPLRLVMDSQRVDLQPGSYVTIRNGELAVNSTIWTTHDMENADRKARELHRALTLSRPNGETP
jgi:hypothetical protein